MRVCHTVKKYDVISNLNKFLTYIVYAFPPEMISCYFFVLLPSEVANCRYDRVFVSQRAQFRIVLEGGYKKILIFLTKNAKNLYTSVESYIEAERNEYFHCLHKWTVSNNKTVAVFKCKVKTHIRISFETISRFALFKKQILLVFFFIPQTSSSINFYPAIVIVEQR